MICPNCKSNVQDNEVLCPNCSYNLVADNQKQDIVHTEEFKKSVGLGCRLYIAIPLIILGLLLLTPIFLYFFISSNYEKTNATLTENCTYNYFVNNQKYTYTKEKCNNDEKIEIIYDKDNPEEAEDSDYITKEDVILCSVGSLFFLISGIMILFPTKNSLYKKLIENRRD